MEYMEFNPIEPSKYDNFVPRAKKERNDKIVLVVIHTIRN